MIPVYAALGDRFVLEQEIGRGGMGVVFRAFDLKTNQTVAVKLIDPGSDGSARIRFDREARCLAALQHEGIVRYIDHGITVEGLDYLAMEWLEGRDLAAVLAHQMLSVTSTLHLAKRLADALSMAHSHGMVHRDIKPSNVFLREGRADQAVLLDFGVARGGVVHAPGTTTVAGHMMGTPGYLAPELTRGEVATTSADIFSLGCVLFECLAGRPPFIGNNLTAVLAKTVFEQPPALEQIRPEVPPELAALIARMMSKDPSLRPESAVEISASLSTFAPTQRDAGAEPQIPVLTAGEQRLVTVLVVDSQSRHEDEIERLRAALGGRVELAARMPDGTIVAAFTQQPGEEASDHAERAVRCGLLLKERLQHASIVIATGRGSYPERMPIGEAVDRAVALLSEQRELFEPVLTDDVTSGLINSRFDLKRIRTGLYAISSERDVLDETRPLLGQPTPCVGRESELALLEATLLSTIEVSVARAVLAIGAPGVGKSRLRHEFMRRVSTRGIDVKTWIGRGDPLRAGSPFSLIGQVLRRVCGISGSEPLEQRQQQICERVARSCPAPEVRRIAELLGEMSGTPFPGELSPPLRTARNDPRTLMVQATQALVDFIRAECTEQPLMLVLEDLHWADSLSIALVSTALRNLADRPLFVLALARREIEETFPNLWADRNPQRLHLGGLGKRACERLARHVLGPDAPSQSIARIVQQAAGNALYLEELIRAVAEDKGAALPDSVLAMLQARLLSLPPDARRTLRAASVFGEVFWLGGVLVLLGRERGAAPVEESLNALVSREIIEQSGESRFAGETEYVFRHALMREAAYRLLTDSDRSLGHRLAGGFLESCGERDPMVIAEHFERGGAPERALRHFIAAAERALSGSALEQSLKCVEHGLRCSPDRHALGSLRSLQLLAYFWQNAWPDAYQAGREALRQLDTYSPRWFRAAAVMLPVLNFSNRPAEFMELAVQLDEIKPPQDARNDYLQAVAYLVIMFSLIGQADAAEHSLAQIRPYLAALSDSEDGVRGVILFSKLIFSRMLRKDPWRTRELARQALAASNRAGDLRNILFVRAFWGLSLLEMGEYDRAESELRSNVELAERLCEPLLLANARIHIELLFLSREDKEEHEAALRSAQETLTLTCGNPFLEGQALANLAQARLCLGDPETALVGAREAALLLSYTPGLKLIADRIAIDALVKLGRFDEAVAEARSGLAVLDMCDCGGPWEIPFRAAAVEALHRATTDAGYEGLTEEARAACQVAWDHLLGRASHISALELRLEYIRGTSVQRRLTALAEALLPQAGRAAASRKQRTSQGEFP